MELQMERDFMGLDLKKVKEEEITPDGCYNSGSARGSAMQWSFSNKVSAIPQFLSFKGAQEDRPRRNGYDSLPSTGYMTISTAEAMDPNHKPYSGVVQKNLNLEKQVGSHYTVTTYTPQHLGAHSVHRPQEARFLPISNPTSQMVPVAMSTPLHQSFITSAGQSVISSTVNQQPIGGVPIRAPSAIGPRNSSIVGNTDLRNASKAPGAPAQMTIFYDGLVCVYDDVCPEKAQAIMLLAGNGPSVTPSATLPVAQVQAPMPRPSMGDGFIFNQSHSTPPCLGLSRHISVTSHNVSQSAGGTSSTNDITAVKPIVTTSPSTIPEPSKVVSSLGSVPRPMAATAVPQARKASLARFLEKRKERVMNTSPYVNNQSPDCSPHGSGSRACAVNSAGSSPLPAIN